MCVSVSGETVAARTSAIYGDQGVRFNDDGRPLYPGDNVRPSRANLLLWRRDRRDVADHTNTAAPAVDTQRYRPYSRTTVPAQNSQQVRAAPFITRRFDAPRSYQTTKTVTTMRPEVVVIEEMKVYDEKPCGWWLFIVLGIVMFLLGLLNMAWCWEYHWFSRFWCSILVRTSLLFKYAHSQYTSNQLSSLALANLKKTKLSLAPSLAPKIYTLKLFLK